MINLMTEFGMASKALAWILTYLLHSSLFLGTAWLLARLMPTHLLALRERIWKTAVIAGLLTASWQVCFQWQPLFGVVALPVEMAGHNAILSQVTPPVPNRESTGLHHTADGLDRKGGEPALFAGQNIALIEDPAKKEQGLEAGIGLAMDASQGTNTKRELGIVTEEKARHGWHSHLASFGQALPGVLLWFWLLTFVAGFMVLVWRYLNLALLLRQRREIRSGEARLLLGKVLGSSGLGFVKLSQSPRIKMPIAFGIWRPEICLPSASLERLKPSQLETLLAHEAAHLLYRDPIWLLVGQVMEHLFVWQPLNRVARREIQEISEFRCDDWAVVRTGNPLGLAKCLTEVASWQIPGWRQMPTPAMAQKSSVLGNRIRRLVVKKPKMTWPKASSLFLVLASGMLAVAAITAPGVAPEPVAPVLAEPAAAPVALEATVAPAPPTLAEPAGPEAAATERPALRPAPRAPLMVTPAVALPDEEEPSVAPDALSLPGPEPEADSEPVLVPVASKLPVPQLAAIAEDEGDVKKRLKQRELAQLEREKRRAEEQLRREEMELHRTLEREERKLKKLKQTEKRELARELRQLEKEREQAHRDLAREKRHAAREAEQVRREIKREFREEHRERVVDTEEARREREIEAKEAELEMIVEKMEAQIEHYEDIMENELEGLEESFEQWEDHIEDALEETASEVKMDRLDVKLDAFDDEIDAFEDRVETSLEVFEEDLEGFEERLEAQFEKAAFNISEEETARMEAELQAGLKAWHQQFLKDLSGFSKKLERLKSEFK